LLVDAVSLASSLVRVAEGSARFLRCSILLFLVGVVDLDQKEAA
jgi:hypothetical protein